MSTLSTAPAADRLDVVGATLHYEVRGSGPLLLVVGQPMTGGAFAPLADLLAEDHTVVTYDPRGLGASTVQDPALAVTPEVEADDLALVVEALAGGPADVCGSSGGAVAALALAVRHPERVRTVVAHEPPVTELLPDAAHIRAAVDAVELAYRSGGPGAAWTAFVSLVMHHGPVTEAGIAPVAWPPPGQDTPATEDVPPPPSPEQLAHDELFFLRMLKPFTRYRPEVDTLRSGQPRVVVGVGATSQRELAVRSAAALAERLGTAPVAFPGEHGGFLGDPAGFAEVLRRAL
jgi:pimeloyl-ACP methyl ester carboxylesterase